MAKSKVKVVFKESVHSFKTGTKVKLKNSDIVMSVKTTSKNNINPNKTLIVCTWEENGIKKESSFPMFDLENVSI